MESKRTDMEISADKFDLALFRLISASSDFALNGPVANKATWSKINRLLSEARPSVRIMMHREDRETT